MRILSVPGLCIAAIMALTSSSISWQPAAAQTKASDQLKKANEGTAARNHTFDGTKAPPNAVRANPAPKPSMVGRPVSEFKPQVRVTPSQAPPAPARNLNPTGDKAVQKGIDKYKKPGTR